MAGRHSRNWIKGTYTLSPEVVRAVAVRAAQEGLDPGTIIDSLIWNAWLKPDEARLKAGGLTDDELERDFAEDVLAFIDTDEKVQWLSTTLWFDESKGSDLKQTQTLVKRWRTTRRIEKDRQEELLAALSAKDWFPRIHAAVKGDWFLPD
jgi:hypothetical protein